MSHRNTNTFDNLAELLETLKSHGTPPPCLDHSNPDDDSTNREQLAYNEGIRDATRMLLAWINTSLGDLSTIDYHLRNDK